MPVGGRKLSIEEALALCYAVGFKGEKLLTAVAVMTAESGRFVEAYNINVQKDGDTSLDRGLFQINTLHRSLGMADSFKAAPNAQFAHTLSNGGDNFSPWSAFKSGAYEQYVNDVRNVRREGAWEDLVDGIEVALI
jgi:hypothetical protein